MARKISTAKRVDGFEYYLLGLDEVFTLSIKADEPLSPEIKERLSTIRKFSGLETKLGIGKIEIQSDGNYSENKNPLVTMLNYMGLFQEASAGYFPELNYLIKTVDEAIDRFYPTLVKNEQTDGQGRLYIDLFLSSIELAAEEKALRASGLKEEVDEAKEIKDSLTKDYKKMERKYEN